MKIITPCLWFDNQAEDAVGFYTSIFKQSKILNTTKYGEVSAEVSGMPKGTVLTVEFELNGQRFLAMNGGPVFKFSPAVSFIINCEDQSEIDYYWDKLTAGGDKNAQQCGWLQDKYGVSWQVVPSALEEMLTDSNHEKAEKVMKAMLQMKKIDLHTLVEIYSQN